jgi:hypothetical protein
MSLLMVVFFVFFIPLVLGLGVQALPVKALVLQSWAVTPEMAARAYSGSFSSLGQSPVPPLPHIPSCPTGAGFTNFTKFLIRILLSFY